MVELTDELTGCLTPTLEEMEANQNITGPCRGK